ncbi:LAFA_0E14840g1_1 [Lachancea sp. 'fantastica']|nr:LAFA_0E14840g1_1 [Lachancea sp. 'fantastica']
MAVILNKRYVTYYDNSYNGSWVWGRWLLFIVLAVAVVLWVFMINVRRRRNGVSPIRGTAWLAPPSYGVSQNQYNLPTDQNPVPEYSATANVNDAGYFDQNGKFHRTHPGPNDPQPQQEYGNGSQPSQPPPAVVRDDDYYSEDQPRPEQDFQSQFQRPNVPPPAANVVTDITGSTTTTTTAPTESPYQRPAGPPPAKHE